MIQVWVPPSGDLPPACLRCAGGGFWETALRSLLPLSLQDVQPPIPDGPSSCPCPFQISCQPAGASPSQRGCASHAQDAPQRAKSSEVEGPSIFGLDSIFLRINSPLAFFESAFFLPLDFEALKNSLTPFFLSFGSGPQNHTPKFCAKLTPCLPNRPALTPSHPPLSQSLSWALRMPLTAGATRAGLSCAAFALTPQAFGLSPLMLPSSFLGVGPQGFDQKGMGKVHSST